MPKSALEKAMTDKFVKLSSQILPIQEQIQAPLTESRQARPQLKTYLLASKFNTIHLSHVTNPSFVPRPYEQRS